MASAVPSRRLRGDRRRRHAEAAQGPHSARRTPQQGVAHRLTALGALRTQAATVPGHHSVTFTLAKYGSHFSHGMLEPEEYLTDLDVAELGDPAAA
jgi:hypothetical protein